MKVVLETAPVGQRFSGAALAHLLESAPYGMVLAGLGLFAR